MIKGKLWGWTKYVLSGFVPIIGFGYVAATIYFSPHVVIGTMEGVQDWGELISAGILLYILLGAGLGCGLAIWWIVRLEKRGSRWKVLNRIVIGSMLWAFIITTLIIANISFTWW